MGAPHEASPPAEATAQMLTWLNGDLLIQALYTVAALGIADLVADEAKTAKDLAIAAGVEARALYQVLRMLAGHGVFLEDAEGRFGLTPLAVTLLRDRPGSVRDWVLFVGDPATWSATGNLLRSVRTGESAFATTHGMSLDAYLAQHPALGAAFDGWMTRQSGLHNDDRGRAGADGRDGDATGQRTGGEQGVRCADAGAT
jgi:hypothetical protein